MSSEISPPINPPNQSQAVAKLTDSPLTNEALFSIAKLIRAMAEIEDCLNLFICNLAEINETKMLALIGRTPYSRKLEIARVLATVRKDAATTVFKKAFTPEIATLKKTRDVVAHGPYLGLSTIGNFTFLSQDSDGIHGESLRLIVFGLSAKRLMHLAKTAEGHVARLEKLLQIEPLRKTRSTPTLEPLQKGQQQSSKKQKRQLPP